MKHLVAIVVGWRPSCLRSPGMTGSIPCPGLSGHRHSITAPSAGATGFPQSVPLPRASQPARRGTILQAKRTGKPVRFYGYSVRAHCPSALVSKGVTASLSVEHLAIGDLRH